MNTYRHINKLPLSVFADITETGDLTLLLLTPQPQATAEELQTIWEMLQMQYHEAILGDQDESEVRTKAEQSATSMMVQRAGYTLDLIEKTGIAGLYGALYTFGYDLPELTNDNREQVLQLFIANYKRDYVTAQLYIKENEGSEGKGVTIDYNYFLTTLVDMSTAFKVDLSIERLMTGAYCAYVRKYRQYCNQLSKQHHELHND